MFFKRRLLGVCLGSSWVLLQACGNTSSDPNTNRPGSAGAAGSAGLTNTAGDANGQAGSGVGGSSSAGSSGSSSQTAGSGGSQEGDLGGEGGATDPGTAGGGAGGGSAGSGGTGGSGGAFAQDHSSKLDVLLVIDNSVSMSDKQEVLLATLPAFLARLTNPFCLDANRKAVVTQPTSVNQACITGTREFVANDIHIGVISTSLGAHGGTVCSAPPIGDPLPSNLDDRGELLGKLRPGLTTWQASGFLSWDPSGVTGSSNAADLTHNLAAQIDAAGDRGCGYEAPLEAMYRFLIDPEPPATVTKVGVTTVRSVELDTELLAERAAFLRPDSSVAILALSDENDCSVRDDGVGWFVGASTNMPKATAACATNANDPCCRSCAQGESVPPTGCVALAADPVCMGASAGQYNMWDRANDSLNLRCFHQKQRFGFDLLYPTTRYSSGLSDLMIPNNAGTPVKNPLFYDKSGAQTRSPSLVSLSVLVGVPWQDLATSASIAPGGKLEYLDAAGLTAQGRWPMLLGAPRAFVDAQDPLMVESIAARTGTQPLTGFALAPATSHNPLQNQVNGHEFDTQGTDLQYSCIFPLPQPKVCAAGDAHCDCAALTGGDTTVVVMGNSPACQPPTGGPAGTTQYFAKAYPGLRELEVVHDLGYRGVAASICPKTLIPADNEFGYGPAFDALVRRVSNTLN